MYFIDVQGTLISDKDQTPIRGSIDFIKQLNSEKIPYMIVTNNTKHASNLFLESLQEKGFELDVAHYIDPLMLLDNFLEQNNIAAYGNPQFLATLEAKGYRLDFDTPAYVVLGIKHDYSFDDFAQMIGFILQGAKLIGMHETTLYAKGEKRYPGTGAVLQMLKAATSAEYVVVGKPSQAFYTKANEMLSQQIGRHVNFEEITMISDDIKGDLVGAKALGCTTQFVLSGKYQKAEEIIPFLEKSLHPDQIFDDMQAALEWRDV